MRPLQLWLPLFPRSPAFPAVARDMARAFEAWASTHRIWVMPGLPKELRWGEEADGHQVHYRAIAGEEWNYLDIFHIGENGFVYGLDADRFPGARVDGLLDAWLNWPTEETIGWQEPPRLEIAMPDLFDQAALKENQIPYRQVSFTAPVLPIDPKEGIPTLPAGSPRPVFPEVEISEFWQQTYGPLQFGQLPDGQPVVTNQDGTFFRPAATLVARGLLAGIFPTGVSLDAMHNWAKMNGIVQRSATDPTAALQWARTLAAPYFTEGVTTRALSWYMPTLGELREVQEVINRAASLGLVDARVHADLRGSEAWHRAMTESVPIRRVWGPVGLFWALLIDRLEQTGARRACGLCGRVLEAARRTKQFCGKSENPECYRRRRALDRRRERDETAGSK